MKNEAKIGVLYWQQDLTAGSATQNSWWNPRGISLLQNSIDVGAPDLQKLNNEQGAKKHVLDKKIKFETLRFEGGMCMPLLMLHY